MPTKAAKLKRTRAQRIPFRPGDRYSNRGPDTFAQTNSVTFIFACNTAADHTFRVADNLEVMLIQSSAVSKLLIKWQVSCILPGNTWHFPRITMLLTF